MNDEQLRAAIQRKNQAFAKLDGLQRIAAKYRKCGNEPPAMIAGELASAENDYKARLAEVEAARDSRVTFEITERN